MALMKGAQISRPPVHRITLVQLACLVLLSAGTFFSLGKVFAVSVLCGGLVAILPQAYFAARAFRWRGANAAREIARSSYAGEIGKYVLSVAGFALVFAAVRPIEGAAVFGGYLAMLLLQIIGSWLLLR